ncbi:MAG: tryptophan-rich sensory protein [Proteobacteria bacterium]|nr:tryptophan-rich sensory protein [Pseudomonadota bacterium]
MVKTSFKYPRIAKALTWLLFYGSTICAASGAIWFTGNLNDNDWISPSFAPPAWLFGPVWATLYILIATSAYRLVYAQEHLLKPIAFGLWALQMCLNTIWTPIFFGALDLHGAMIIILFLWLSISGFILVTYNIDCKISYLFIPYWLWVSFASILNFVYIVIN